MISTLFKQDKGSFERTERKDQGNGFLVSVLDPLCSIEKSDLVRIDLPLHCDDGSLWFQERVTQEKKRAKIRECSRESDVKSTLQTLEYCLVLYTAVDGFRFF